MSKRWILSATEIETFQTCRRKWALRYIDQIEIKPSAAAQLGSMVHLALENYLIDNAIDIQTRAGQIASAGLHFLPKSILNDHIERHILFSHSGFIFQGYIDFFHHLGSQTWLIGDHKTCSSFSTALTDEELKTNIQASIYAQWAFQELGAETVKLRWIYYRTKGKPEARCIESEIKKEEQPSLFDHPLVIASNIMATLQEKPDSLDLPKNLNACFKYGPCPFLASCKANQKPRAALLNSIEVKKLTVSTASPTEANDVKSVVNEAFHLYVDCIPVKSENSYQRIIELSELLKPVLTKIQTEKELSHYRLAGYGQHVGLIAHYLSKHLENHTYDKHTAILSSVKTPEGCDTMQTLASAAGRIVRGF